MTSNRLEYAPSNLVHVRFQKLVITRIRLGGHTSTASPKNVCTVYIGGKLIVVNNVHNGCLESRRLKGKD